MSDFLDRVEIAFFDALALRAADRARGVVLDASAYARRFPGLEDRVREHLRLVEQQELVLSSAGLGEVDEMASPARELELVGHYRLIRELGRGGQGVVHLAEDTRLRRRVALKVLAGLARFSPDARRRFQREAETASRLDHPAICTVYEGGFASGVAYIAMRHVEGESLARRIAAAREARSAPTAQRRPCAPGTRDELCETLRCFETIARALHVAHEARIIHRDIKPANLMLTPAGEPVVLDFGLAREVELPMEPAERITHTGDAPGTPAYLSPEQLEPRGRTLDRRTDVYSLGVTLYECLTLELPHRAPTIAALYQQILHDPPRDPRTTNRSIPPDLAIVLETALEKDPSRRYATALDFAEDLRRIREREPIRARPPSAWLRVLRWVQRHPAKTIGTAAVVLACSSAIALRAIHLKNELLEQAKQLTDAENEAHQQRIDDGAVRDGLLDVHADTPMRGGIHDWAAEARAYLAKYAAFGAPLDDPQALERTISKLEQARIRDAELGADLIDGLYWVAWTIADGPRRARLLAGDAVPADLAPDALEHRPWSTLRANLDRVIDECEYDDWRRDVWSRYRSWLVDGEDRLDAAPALRKPGLTSRELVFLHEITYLVRRDASETALLDEAIDAPAGSENVRFAARLNRGITNMGAGAADAAIRDLTVACELRPRSAAAWIARARAEERAGDLPSSLASARRALGADAGNAMAWRVATGLCLKLGLLDEAEHSARRAGELVPSDPTPCMDGAIVALRRCDHRLSIARWAQAARYVGREAWAQAGDELSAHSDAENVMQILLDQGLRPPELGLLLAEYARSLGSRGCLAEAAQAAEFARWTRPEDARLAFEAVEAWGRVHDFERARVAADAAVRLDPTHVEAHVLLAFVLVKLKRFDEACAVADQALWLEQSTSVELTHVRVLASAGRTRQALDACRELVARIPADLEVTRELARILWEADRRPEALHELLELTARSAEQADFAIARQLAVASRAAPYLHEELANAIARHPESVRLRLVQAEVARESGARDQMVESLRAARSIEPISVGDLELLAAVCARCGQPRLCADASRRGLELVPRSTTFHLQLLNAQESMYDFDAEVGTASSLLEIVPHDADALISLTRAALQCGMPDAAARYVTKAIEERPRDQMAQRCRAMILRVNGNPLAARELVDAALRRDPDSLTLRRERVDIAVHLGEWEEAVEEFEALRPRFIRPSDRDANFELAKFHEHLEASRDAARRCPPEVKGISRIEWYYLRGNFAAAVEEFDGLLSGDAAQALPVNVARYGAMVLARQAEARSSPARPGAGGAPLSESSARWPQDVLDLTAKACAMIELVCERLPVVHVQWLALGAPPDSDPRKPAVQLLTDRDLLVLRVPPMGAPWAPRARAAFVRLRDELRLLPGP